MVKNEFIRFIETGVCAEVSHFSSASHCDVHMMLHVSSQMDFEAQLNAIIETENKLFNYATYSCLSCVMKRYFLSDIVNQAPVLHTMQHDDSYSVVQQPPLDGSKIAVWIWLTSKEDVSADQHIVFNQFIPSSIGCQSDSSAAQTTAILNAYENELNSQNCRIAEHSVRTWFFVRDVDTQYAGMVDARRKFFEEHGLTDQTHYLASTGIGGLPENTKDILLLDTLTIYGVQPSRLHYLQAKTHLNPTYEYGVTFERGTKVDFLNHSHIFISGTASIDNKGNVLFEGNITKQTQRMLENVQMLLQEGGAELSDVVQAIVYLRDIADYSLVSNIIKERLPLVPMVITYAPVCRPTWLIEMECIASI